MYPCFKFFRSVEAVRHKKVPSTSYSARASTSRKTSSSQQYKNNSASDLWPFLLLSRDHIVRRETVARKTWIIPRVHQRQSWRSTVNWNRFCLQWLHRSCPVLASWFQFLDITHKLSEFYHALSISPILMHSSAGPKPMIMAQLIVICSVSDGKWGITEQILEISNLGSHFFRCIPFDR